MGESLNTSYIEWEPQTHIKFSWRKPVYGQIMPGWEIRKLIKTRLHSWHLLNDRLPTYLLIYLLDM